MSKQISSSIIPIISESERVLAGAITHFGLTVKPEQIRITVQSKGRKQAIGWFAPHYWLRDKAKGAAKGETSGMHEINLSAEHLQNHDMGELILHELAHAENNVLGIKDCSNGRMHNKKFKVMAEKLGLEVHPRDKSVGYGFTDLAAGGKEFLAKVKFDRAVFNSYRGGGFSRGKKPGSRLLKCECPECGYVCRTTQKWIDDVGAPHCPDHGEMGVDA